MRGRWLAWPGLTRIIGLLLLAVAGWPVLRWYALRMTDGSDEPFGWFALAAAVVLAPRRGWRAVPSATALLGALGMICLYASSLWFAPPLVRAVIWVSALALLIGWRSAEEQQAFGRVSIGGWALLVLSLPLVPSVQFYLGYPLRMVTTIAASWLLRAFGLRVDAEGTILHWRGEQVLIDAPCSGVQMLWSTLVLISICACITKASTREVFRLFRRAGLVVFAANTVRAAALFCVESGLWPNPVWAHDAIGLALFAGAALVTVSGVKPRLGKGGAEATVVDEPRGGARWREGDRAKWWMRVPGRAGWLAGAFVAACTLSAVLPAVVTSTAFAKTVGERQEERFLRWDAIGLPVDATPRELSPAERRFADDFPGRIEAYDTPDGLWIVRRVSQPTRKLHPSVDCLRASGYEVVPGAAWKDAAGCLWAGASAVKAGTRYQVLERVISIADPNRGWTDVSAWYWNAVLKPGTGPWLAITRIERR